MFRTIVWFAYFSIYLVCTYPALMKVKKLHKLGQKKEKEALIYKTVKNWSKRLVSISGTTVRVNGTENLPKEGSFVVVSNHQGNFDIPILLGFLDCPVGFISKIELKKMPIIREWMIYMNCVFIDRKDRRQGIRAINQGAEYVKNGSSIVIFPEGTRSKGVKKNSFKSGSFKLAQKAGATIVPVVINGSYKIMEQNGFLIKPAEVTVTILPQIKAEDYLDTDLKLLAAKVEELINNELHV